METTFHFMSDLFLQMGLPNNKPAIDDFIRIHKGIPHSTPIWEADFWTPSQAAFLKESYDEDSDWVQVVDHLDTLLRD